MNTVYAAFVKKEWRLGYNSPNDCRDITFTDEMQCPDVYYQIKYNLNSVRCISFTHNGHRIHKIPANIENNIIFFKKKKYWERLNSPYWTDDYDKTAKHVHIYRSIPTFLLKTEEER